MTNQRMTGAQALIRALENVGVDTIFGIPDGAILPAYDPLFDSPLIRHILVRHEQGAGHAAEGYARTTGKVGVCMATSGPGATNLVTPIADAYADSVPIVAITGQVPSQFIGTDAFQEADICSMTMTVTKHSFLVTDAAEIGPTISEAFHIASTGRPGPVLVDISKDALQADIEFLSPQPLRLRGYQPAPRLRPEDVRAASQLIGAAKRPVLYVGGGVVSAGAHNELTASGVHWRNSRGATQRHQTTGSLLLGSSPAVREPSRAERPVPETVTLSPINGTASLGVALHIGSDVIAHGLEAVLKQIADVRSVLRVDLRSLPGLIADDEIDVLVVSFDLWSDLEGIWDPTAHRTKILVTGSDLHTREIESFSSLPVDGFLALECISAERLNDTLSRLMNGEVPLPSELAYRLLNEAYPVVTRRRRAHVELTAREKQTLALLVKGMSNKHIARGLGISTHGAKRLVTAILLKMGVPNRTAAAGQAIDSGLIPERSTGDLG
jgi:DNA-binding NarL/FixJ family response regulator